MNLLDILILIFIGLLVFNGVRKGLIISLASLVALILGIWTAVHFSFYLGNFLERQLHPSGSWLPILSFTLTFLVVIILVILIAKGVEKLVDLSGMGFFNHLAGGIFGLAKGLIFASVLLYVVSNFDPKEKLITRKVKETSFLYGIVEKVFPCVMRLFGGEAEIRKWTD